MIWLLALIFTAAWATPADAATLVGAITALAGGVSTALAAGGLQAFLLRTAASMALSALGNYLSQASSPGIQTDVTTTGDTTPQSFILGRYATAGHHVAPAYVDGSWLWYVIDLSNVPIGGVTRLAVNKDWMVLDEETTSRGLDFVAASTTSAGGESKYAGKIEARFYDGTQTTADARLLHYFGDHDTRPWLSDMVGTGTAYAIVAFQQTRRRLFPSFPEVRFEVDGIKLYDPRKDTTVGGSGAHRFADPTTWEFTRNPAVMLYNIRRGITLRDGRVWGYGYSADRLPLAPWFAAMNECDVAVDLDAGGTEPQYQAGIEVKVGPEAFGGSTPISVEAELLKACSGEIAETGGQVTIRVGPPALPVLFITDDDLVITRESEFHPFPGLEGTRNGITGTYPDPSLVYEVKDAPPRYDDDLEAEDGDNRLAAAVQFPSVTSGTQVQRLMLAWLEDQRRFRRHVLPLPPRAAVLEPLDTLEWSSTANGYIDKLFEVRAVGHQAATLQQAVTVRERDPDDYDWSVEFELPSPTPSPVDPGQPVSVLSGWGVTATVIRDADDNARRPALLLSWSIGDQSDASGIEWQVRVTGTVALVAQGTTTDTAAGSLVVSEGILPATTYQARGRLVANRPTDWTDWAAATTGDVRLIAADISAAINDAITAAQEAADDARTEADTARDEAAQIADDLLGLESETVAPLVARVNEQTPRLITTERYLEDVWGRLAERSIEHFDLSERVARAGIYVDPANGEVRIEGVVATEERIGTAEVLISGLEAQIQLRATLTEVNQIVSDALLDPTQIPIIDDLQATVAQVQIDLDAAEAAIALTADQITVDGLDARVTTAEADIDAAEAAILLRVTQADFDEVETRVGVAEVTIATLGDAPTITQTVQQSRQSVRRIEDAAGQTLLDLLSGYSDREIIREANASAQQQITAFVTEGFQAEAVARLSLEAEVDGVAASVETETAARVSGDEAIASDVAAVDARLTTAEGTVAGQATAITAITSRVTDVEGDITAITSAQSTLEATVADNTAAISNEAVTRSSADDALAGSIASLTTTVGANTAAISAEAVTRAAEDDALASDITGLDTRLTTAEGTVSGQATAISGLTTRVTNTEGDVTALSSALTALDATVDTNTAAISAEATARADADSALASDISTVSATAAGLSASVTTQATAIADIEGHLSATYSLVVSGSGGAARLVLVSSDAPDGTPFTGVSLDAQYIFVGGVLQSNNYSAGSAGWRITQSGDAEFNSLIVRNDMIAPGAITESVDEENAGPVVVGTTSTSGSYVAEFASLPQTFPGETWVVGFACELKGSNFAGRVSAQQRVMVDGVFGNWETLDGSERSIGAGNTYRKWSRSYIFPASDEAIEVRILVRNTQESNSPPVFSTATVKNAVIRGRLLKPNV